MSAKCSPPLPGILIVLGSTFVGFHLLAIGALVLSAESGPWPTPFGPSQAVGPPFASRVAAVTTQYYLMPLKMTHNYHFVDNRPDAPGIEFEVRLKDEQGRLIESLRFPSPHANPWLRQRQTLLAQSLGEDEQVQPEGEQIPAPGKAVKTVDIWEAVAPNQVALHNVPTYLVPKTGASRPREWSLIVARSYMRHLCREYGAASAELVRYSRRAAMPGYLFLEEAPPGTFDTLASTFEEYHREK